MSPGRSARDRRRRPDAAGTGEDRAPASAAAATEGEASAPGAQGRDRGAAWRTPAIVLVVAALVSAVVLTDRFRAPDPPGALGLVPARFAPLASPASAPSSTWFCAAGTARGSEERVAATAEQGVAAPPVVAEHRVVIANAAEAPRNVRVTAYPLDGEPVARDLRVEAGSRAEVRVAELVRSPFASALVEADGGLVAVEHTVQGPTGRSSAPCATAPSTTWYFPAGSTRLGTRTLFVVFNPFPDAANVDLSFEADEPATGAGGGAGDDPQATVPGTTRPAGGAGSTPPGTAGSTTRESERFKGVVVRPRSLTVLDVTDVITVRNQLSTTVTARAGRVVVDELVVADGTSGSPTALSLVPGAPRGASTWLFAGMPPVGDDRTQQYVVYNPTDDEAEVSVSVVPDVGGAEGAVEPYDVRVRPREFQVVDLGQDARVPPGVGGWVVARSTGTPVVVARTARTDTGTDATAGIAITLGTPILAREWIVPSVGQGVADGEVAIANPSAAEPVTVTVRGFRGGGQRPLEGYDGVTVNPGDRLTLDPAALGGRAELLLVQATGAVVVERREAGATTGMVSDAMAIAVDGSAVLPPVDLFDRGALLDLGPGTVLTPETVIGGTVPGSGPGIDVGTVPPDLVPPDASTTAPEATATTTPDATATTVPGADPTPAPTDAVPPTPPTTVAPVPGAPG